MRFDKSGVPNLKGFLNLKISLSAKNIPSIFKYVMVL
jgi:hypothetical protein